MNGILIVNKPQNMTSFDVVAQVRRKLKAKVGHAGTLDPMATGILVLAINKATKALNYIGVENKTYVGKVKLGLHTDTGDVWGKVDQEASVPIISQDQIIAVLESFIGQSQQRVPKVSAKKVDGKRSYDYVFSGQEVKQLYTDINISELEFLSFDGREIEFKACVSNGTYIRTLCEDIAQALGTLGAMSYLNRTQVGVYDLSHALELDAIDMETPLEDTKDAIVLDRIMDDSLAERISHGKRIELDTKSDQVFLDAGS